MTVYFVFVIGAERTNDSKWDKMQQVNVDKG
jgi:hypothetical protein